MKFDLSLSPFDATVAGLVSAARVAEISGFDAVWTNDHFSGVVADAGSVLDPWVVLSAIAVRTDTIGLGPLVLNATIRHPSHVAVAGATLQELSHGRLLLGMGAGAGTDRFGIELAMVGLPRRPAAERRIRVAEAVAHVRALWRGVPDLEGSYHHLAHASGFRRPSPEPPIVIGANGPKMAALAGRIADGVNFHWYEQDLEKLVDTARAASQGRDFQVTVEAPLEAAWLVGRGRERLERLEVARVIYRWTHELGNEAIAEAARLLGSLER